MATLPRGGRLRTGQAAGGRVNVVQGEPVVAALRRAVRDALLEHKRAGNPVAASRGGETVIITAEEIAAEETPDGPDRS